ncbi:hypothetical protein ABZ234_19425 [Nocardiopsis sp. NPDC006198]|uniref:hypothetical protein n=1 Tax=Nocardiopsis sp. NPDC006198 TaxID=3154472 RepID=UPI0033B7C1AD
MVDEKAPPAKQGLHGWRAAAAVFGCGSLAAFGVFGVVVALLSTFLSTVSSGIGGPEQSDAEIGAGAAQTTSPRDEFESDKFDLCRISLPTISGVGLILEDGMDAPVDTAVDGGNPRDGDLVRSGECSGVLNPAASTSTPWEFNFSYRAIIFAPEGSRDEMADAEVDAWRSGAEESVGNFQEGGDLNILDRSYYVYGASVGGGAEYVAVARKRSAVLEFSMSSADENTPAEFSHEVEKFESHLDIALQNLIPR